MTPETGTVYEFVIEIILGGNMKFYQKCIFKNYTLIK